MTGYVRTYNGKTYELPTLFSWEFSYADGEPCDAFEVEFGYVPGMREILSDAVGFYAEHEGERVFTGVVDEFEATASGTGRTVALHGRSPAALLLDNEAEAADYYGVTLRYILEKHVIPYGVTDISVGEAGKAETFSVASGTSQWKVLSDFCRFCCGVQPRFSRSGTLLLTGEKGQKRVLDYDNMVSRQTWRETRYGELSAVLVKNRVLGLTSWVKNEDFLSRGGCCTRVVNVPRNQYYDRMRYTGEYQIGQSKKDKRVCTVTLPVMFAAFPEDTVELKWNPLEIYGTFRVTGAVCRGGSRGAETVLSLEEK